MSVRGGLAPRADAAIVAVGRGSVRTRGQLAVDVATVAAGLGPSAPGTERLVVCQGRYAFAVALLACWERGEVALLPPNLSPGVLAGLAAGGGLVHDGHLEAPAPEGSHDVRAWLGHAGPAASLGEPDPGARLVRLLTSGSTGASRPVDKVASQLLGEARALAAAFSVGDGQRVVATIPPHHVYGLLFSVLLPLVSGAVLVDDTPFFAADVAAAVRETSAAVLVTVPAHLRALAAGEAGALAGLVRVFSSGAPLPEDTAVAFAAAHGAQVTEVFGSTETGGVAWRDRLRDPVWTALPGVNLGVEADGRLTVDSPFLPPDAPRPWSADDRVVLLGEGRFEHLGRLDDVVKVASKRVSVGMVERAILGVPGVVDAAVLPIDGPGGVRLRAAVVAPGVTDEALRAALRAQLDAVAVPRMVRVPALPREAHGKLRRDALRALLAPTEAPCLVGRARADGGWEGEARIPEGWRWFDGHFPGDPILPGVAQLAALVVPAVALAWPELGAPVGVPQVRFRAVVRPGDTLGLRLTRAGDEVRFELVRESVRCASGAVRFGPRAG